MLTKQSPSRRSMLWDQIAMKSCSCTQDWRCPPRFWRTQFYSLMWARDFSGKHLRPRRSTGLTALARMRLESSTCSRLPSRQLWELKSCVALHFSLSWRCFSAFCFLRFGASLPPVTSFEQETSTRHWDWVDGAGGKCVNARCWWWTTLSLIRPRTMTTMGMNPSGIPWGLPECSEILKPSII